MRHKRTFGFRIDGLCEGASFKHSVVAMPEGKSPSINDADHLFSFDGAAALKKFPIASAMTLTAIPPKSHLLMS
jgi:hypothetical protein